MSGDSFKDREKALEESFFYKRNQQLLDKLKQDLADEDQKRAICEACGITNDAVLESIVSAGIRCETVAALTLAPLVLVAWADGIMQQAERKAVLAGAAAEGVPAESLCGQMLARWLEQEPDPSLKQAWKAYVGAISQQMPAGDRAAFKADILRRARKVAHAAGGILGVASVSREEQALLDELEAAFPD